MIGDLSRIGRRQARCSSGAGPRVFSRAPVSQQMKILNIESLLHRTLPRLCVGLFLASTASLRAQLVVADSFDYPDGPIEMVSGSVWETNYQPSNTVDVIGRRLFLTQSETGSVRITFPAQISTGRLYARFRVTFTELPSASGNLFAFFRQSGVDNLRARVWARTDGAAPGHFRLGINAFSGVPALAPIDLSLGETYTVVMRYNVTNHDSTLWINPLSEADTERRADSPATIFPVVGVMHFGFLQSSNVIGPGGPGTMFVDDLRIGRTFGDATDTAALLSARKIAPGLIEITGSGAPTTNYLVQANETLGTTNWITLGDAVAGMNGLVSFTDTNAAVFPQRFYRLQRP